MTTKLSFRRLRLRRNNKGVSTVFGMVFFLLIAVVIFASFAVVLNQNTALETTMIQNRQMDIDKANEKLTINDAVSTSTGIQCIIENNGGLPVQIIRIWSKTPADTSVTQPLSLIIPAGSSQSIPITTSIPVNTEPRGFWVVTARGNTVYNQVTTPGGTPPPDRGFEWFYGDAYDAAGIDDITPGSLDKDYYLCTDENSIYYGDVWRKGVDTSGVWKQVYDGSSGSSETTYGIGPIGFDFDSFYVYKWSGSTVTSDKSSGYILPVATYPKSTNVIFAARLTNLDKDQRSISLDYNTQFYGLIASNTGAYAPQLFKLVQIGDGSTAYVNGLTIIQLGVTSTISLDYRQAKYFFFQGVTPKDTPSEPYGLYAMNLCLTGKLGTGDYGQNIPFVIVNFKK